ncbi:uncharacterized protein LOC121854751 [Homarus americanus]|uniref:Uncharacterized protein n=1 Tax=Homarus americanus TaxID=6706 RepID=A0A8J5JCT4_HOMAM|nr:uncharacterized protein LOC121854751 [Homarus americanus]KAG7155595.1 hypothetical protein Hamer_G015962 [Homarus americanus]
MMWVKDRRNPYLQRGIKLKNGKTIGGGIIVGLGIMGVTLMMMSVAFIAVSTKGNEPGQYTTRFRVVGGSMLGGGVVVVGASIALYMKARRDYLKLPDNHPDRLKECMVTRLSSYILHML